MSRDTLGQDYLCYLVKNCALTMVRLGHTNTKEPELIVGTVSQIVAKDAVPIPVSSKFPFQIGLSASFKFSKIFLLTRR